MIPIRTSLRVSIIASFLLILLHNYHLKAQSPGNVSTNLELWLKADAGVTGSSPITSWADQSSSSLDATASNGPTLVTNGLNFNPTINFDGTDDRFVTPSTALFSTNTSPVTIFIVFDADDGTSGSYLLNQRYNDNCNTNIQLGYSVGGGPSRSYGLHIGCSESTNSASGTVQDNTFYLMSTLILGSGSVSPDHLNYYQNGESLSLTNYNGGFTIPGSYDTESVPIDIGVRDDTYGAGTSFGGYHDGDIAEIIVYTSTPSAAERQRIQSYLAIKYGITIDQTSATDYLSSDGTTEMWDKDATDASTYDNDIAGIGRDTNSGLGQIKSKSINANAVLIIEAEGEGSNSSPSFSDMDNLEFLTWGNNNGAASWTSTGAPNQYQILSKQWSVQETGDVGTVEISFDVEDTDFDIPSLLSGGGYYVVIDTDDDGDLSDETPVALYDDGTNGDDTADDNVWTAQSIDFDDGEDFTLATLNTFPGNVSADIQLWLKADAGFAVNQWTDQSGNANHATQGTGSDQPSSTSDAMNFNPAITFDGTSDHMDLTNTAGTMGLNSSDYEMFLVSQSGDASNVRFLISGEFEEYEMHTNGTVGLRFVIANLKYSDIGSTGDYGDDEARILGASVYSSGTGGSSVNGLFSTDTEASSQSTSTAAMQIGKRSNDTFYYDGEISEVVIYSEDLSATDRDKLLSYLAIKYGISLDQSSATDYLASDGGTIWDGTANASYNTDITGIGRDDNSDLDQQKSTSTNPNAILTIANGDITTPSSFNADDSWLIWGSDNGATTFGTDNINNADGTTSNRMTRIWRVDETGTVGNVEISFDNSLATGTVSIVIDQANTFENNANRRIIEMTDSGSDYEVTVDFADGEYFSFVNASASSMTSKPVVINEIITEPQQDWSSGNFYNASPGGTAGSDDEWVELYIATAGLDLSSWTIELNDGTDVSGDLSSTGAFDVSNYLSTSGGSITNTAVGDYLILGNVDGSGEMNNTGLTVNLKNGSGDVIDQVLVGSSAPSGNSSDTSDESVSRIPSGEDTNDNSADFTLTRATLGTSNSPTGSVKINEVVTDPQTDWSTNSFNGTDGMSTISEVDEYVELYIGTAGLNLTGWTIEFTDGTDESGELTTSGDGIFGTANYLTTGSGSFINTEVGDYLILGNPDGAINNDVLIVLKDASETEIDRVQLGGGASQAPDGNATGVTDEAIVRYSNATDTGADDADFIQTIASLGATNSPSGTVLINEIVTDPQQDWSTNSLDGTIAGGTVDTEDEWVELYIATAGINLTGWSIELTDGSDVVGNLTNSGAFDIINYVTSGSGTFQKTEAGDYLVLGNVDGSDDMSDNTLITLKDATGTTIDEVQLGGGAGQAPSGAATGSSDESISRIPNATDTDTDDADFVSAAASLGASNAIASLPGVGNGLVFDGTDDYVDLGSQIISASAFTVEAWVNASSFTNSGRFNRLVAIDYGSYTSDNPFVIFVNSSGQIGYVLGTGDASNDQQVPLSFSPSLSISTWYHIALTFDGASKRLYVDGVLYGVINDAGTFTNTNSEQLLIGDFATADTDNGEWEGQLDEVRIWSDERTHEEILENMQTTLVGTETGLTAYYNFDQASGTTLPDIAASNDGTLTNMAGSEWTAAGWNTFSQNAVIFQSNSTDTSPGTSGELTVTDVAFLNDDNDILLVGHENSDFTEVTSDLPSGTLITARYDRNWHVTKNDASGTSNGDVSFSFDLGSTPNSDYNYYLLERTGTSGDFSIVPVDGINPSGTSVVFTVNTSQIDNGSYYTLGRSDAGVGNALEFDGTDDYVDLGTSFGTLDDFTWEAWINHDGTSNQWFLSTCDGTLTERIQVEVNAGAIYFGWQSDDGAISWTSFSGGSISSSTWYHVAVTNSSSTGKQIYVDGVLVATNANTLSPTELGATQTFNIGAIYNTGNYWGGEIDEVRVWNDVRTHDEIVANMYGNLQGDEANLVGYYRMNQGIGNNDSNLPDLSGDNNNGTLTNFDNLNAATASSNYITSSRTTRSNLSLIANGGTLTAASDELTLTSTQTAGDFLQDSGDQIIWSNDDGAFAETTADVPSTSLVTNRIIKTWNLDKNDVSGTAHGNVTFSFNLGTTPTTDYTYYLLSRSGTSGDFSVVEVIDSEPNGNSIQFTVDGGEITDGNYFTLGRSDGGAGNTLDLDGTNDYVDLGDLSLTSGTVEMWIYADDVNDNRRILSQLTGLTTQAGPLGIDPNTAGNNSIYVWSGSTWLELVSLSSDWTSAWHHLAVVYSGGSATAYWDGTEQMTQTTDFDFSGVNMGLGAQYTGANGTTFNGKFDEVRVWNDARTKSEIIDNMFQNLAGDETGLVSYHRFNEGIASGTNTGVDLSPDRSGNGNSASLSGFALSSSPSNWVASQALVVDSNTAPSLVGPGNGLDFDGTDDYVQISDNATLESSSLLTVEAWLRPTSVASRQSAVSRYNTNPDASNVFLLDISASALVAFTINESDNNLVGASSTIAANEWTHVAGVADGTNVHIYVNGILEASTAYDGTITSNSARDLVIGKTRTGDSDGPFVGQIDEVRIWNVARTAVEIQDNMFEELTGGETGLVAYYQFDEIASSTSLPDESSNSNTGILSMDPANDWVGTSAREPFKSRQDGDWNSASTWRGGSVPNSSSDIVRVRHNVALDANISVDRLVITTGGSLTLNSSQTLTISGNMINNGTISGAGTLSFSGTAAQNLGGGSYSNITLNNSSDDITLMGNATVTGTLTLTNGNLILGDNTLTISSGGSISGAGSSSYVQTLNQNSSGGYLQMEVANGAGQITFPVGTSTYTPFHMINLGTTGDFGVRVFDDTYHNGTSGAVNTSNEEIDRTWDINALGSDYNTTITIQWNATEEDGAFTRNSMFVSRNAGGSIWRKLTGLISATGSDPYTASVSGITGFSQIAGGSGDAPLPVTYIDFTGSASDGGVQLNWSTALEINNDRFEVERSVNGKRFKYLNQVAGAGNSTVINQYNYFDANPSKGTNYYRLKQVDYDGAFEYSKVIVVQTHFGLNSQILLYPNPSHEDFTLYVENVGTGSASIRVVSITGEVIEEHEIEMSGVLNTKFGNALLPGIYVLELTYDNSRSVMRIVKQ